MPLFDLGWEDLQAYRPPRTEPKDFDEFWRRTLDDSRCEASPTLWEAAETPLRLVDCWDVTFSGYLGQPVRAWFITPRDAVGPLPAVVEFIGYGGGRGFPTDWLAWPASGFAYLVMDTRGQGGSWSRGDTGDVEPLGNPQTPGFMTRGISSPETYYYRRLMTDAARAVEVVGERPEVDPARIAVTGGSQGGGLSLAAAALASRVAACMADVPFLCHYRRATELTEAQPYEEIRRYLSIHRDQEDTVFNTLSYFDCVNFAPRIQAEALVSVGLMDEICPPSTVMAMYNHLVCRKSLRVYRYNHHEGGAGYQLQEKLRFWQTLSAT